MIVLLSHDATPEAMLLVEQSLRRAGGEPKRVTGSGRVAFTVSGVDASVVDGLSAVHEVLHEPVSHARASSAVGVPMSVHLGDVTVGGTSPVQVIAGPCAVESEDQLETVAAALAGMGVRMLRGGAFKPRTSPYSFRGHGAQGLRWLREVSNRYGLKVVTEVMETGALAEACELADVIQIGSRNMQNFPLLTAVGRTRRPVLLKRGMSATLEEWLLAAEYILEGGNDAVMLCERGVRGFDPAARNLLDLAAVPLLRARTHLPIVVDPSHGVGVRDAVAPMALAAVAAGADAVMIEVHPDPGVARSDGFQALTPAMLGSLMPRLRAVAIASGRG